ncbi:putative gliotoxin biosynthesis protein [Phialemonium atrogriseum]|uniref:gamma-glutamylcyclotransferase n=1 Tax=Phialemonium atrogriseum TaxID=1093897 RepID=A0AAJ0C7D0_9PEZI|nr:putative gliotoxin biosynthesis protein [Phialemonium atrogriseum]KAK1770077.1 putative gliotoxin biosynthesis protein [Phialemonium atrogriseum]
MGQPQDTPDPGSSRAIFKRFCDVEATPISEAITSDTAVHPVPPTPVARLTQPDAAPTPFPTRPVRHRGAHHEAAETVLYLAYGSNLCAKTFQGQRGIRPLSKVNVSAPSLRLTFDLPGIPYMEPCFANTAPRALPKPPPGVPDLPDLPDLPTPPISDADTDTDTDKTPSTVTTYEEDGEGDIERNDRGDPVWTKGLIGVVYEVTRADYARILATEGGGSSYHDILVPCLPLGPTDSPMPFLAHTLCAPRLPLPGDDNDEKEEDEAESPQTPRYLPGWLRKLFLPLRRPAPDHAQPSARYLGLIRDGAREHDLPGEYRAYLAALQPYRMTSVRQRVGLVVFGLAWAPPFVVLFGGSRLVADDKGKIPAWYGMVLAVLFNLVWISYDRVFRHVFGDGERTVEGGKGGRSPWWRRGGEVRLVDDEENLK